MGRLRRNLNYSNVTATLALVLALTGTAYAALSANSVRSRHIAPDAAKGDDVDESTLKAVPTARGLRHPDFGRLGTPEILDGIGIGMVMGRINGLSNTSPMFANPAGVSTASTTEANHLMGTYLSGTEVGFLKIQLLTGTMPSGTSRTFTLRAGNSPATGLSDVMTCTIAENQSSCGVESEVALSQFQDMLSWEIETSGSPGAQTFLFGYSFTNRPGT